MARVTDKLVMELFQDTVIPFNMARDTDTFMMEVFQDTVSPSNEKRLELIANQRREHLLRVQVLSLKTKQHKKQFIRRRTNFGWLETCNKGPNKWGKKINN